MSFDLQITPPSAQTTALAVAEKDRATQEVQAALVIAKKFPRDERLAIQKIKNSCQRPSLANQAIYQYAKGGQNIEGPSIRLAEAVAQHWGNITFGFRVLAVHRGDDGVPVSEVEAYAWDLESNTKRPAHFQVRHWRDKKGGGHQLTDEREIYELVANMAQRRVRACIQSVIPGDVFDEAVEQCTETMKADADTSPTAQKNIVAAFAKFGVSKQQIEKRIQRNLDSITPAQVVSLRKILQSMKDGMSGPGEWFEAAVEGVSVPSLSTDKPLKIEKPKKESPLQKWLAETGLSEDAVRKYADTEVWDVENLTDEQKGQIVADLT